MNRKNFIKTVIGGATMASLQPFYNWTKDLKEEDTKHPVLFIGHGSPMNGIEDNEFSRNWTKFGKEIPKPKAVLVISAHWLTNGTKVTAMENPKTIHDFGGFPQALFNVKYPAPGSPTLATETKNLIKIMRTQTMGLHQLCCLHLLFLAGRREHVGADAGLLQQIVAHHF